MWKRCISCLLRLFFPCCSAQQKPLPQEQTHWRQSIIFLHLCLRRLRRLAWLSSVGVLCRLAWAYRGMTPHRKVMAFCLSSVGWLLLLQRRYWTWFCNGYGRFQKMKKISSFESGVLQIWMKGTKIDRNKEFV